MPTNRSLPKIAGRLQAYGLGGLLKKLANSQDADLDTGGLSNHPSPTSQATTPILGPIELAFSTSTMAKAIQDLLYDWLWFHPAIKANVSLRIKKDKKTLLIFPRTTPETRGRRGVKHR
jgi:hypothetical protein